LAGACVALLGWPAGGVAAAVQPPGPVLTIPRQQLDAALDCSHGIERATHDAVLLMPAFSTGDESFGWNYRRQLPTLGIPACTISLPDHGFGDLQTAAEYVVYASRKVARLTRRRVVLLGHQHGALVEMWALRFWREMGRRVSDYISLATPHRGTTTTSGLCFPGSACPPAAWQITRGSRFLHAVYGKPLPKGPAYTSIATAFDPLITPEPTASRLTGARNILVQDVCPLRPIEHFTILGDAVTYRLVLDAISHAGPADPARINRSACAEAMMPGVPPGAAVSALSFAGYFALASVATSVRAEPHLRRYATG
jgi:triacylglycerol esterase/lipase EstA (alpha/beta hydrolase family)